MAARGSPTGLALGAVLLFGAGVALGLWMAGEGAGGTSTSGAGGPAAGAGSPAAGKAASGPAGAKEGAGDRASAAGAPDAVAPGDASAIAEPDGNARGGGGAAGVPAAAGAGGPGGAPVGSAPPGIPHGVPPGRAEPPPPYELPETISGRAVDALTGMPVPGMWVGLHWQLSDGTIGSSLRLEVGEDGSFRIDPRDAMKDQAESLFRSYERLQARYESPEALLKDLDYAIQVKAEGYAIAEKGDPGVTVEIALVPEARNLLPGRVRVDARWPDGVRYLGRLLVEASTDKGWFSQWALPEPDGTYLLVGVPAGKWGFRVAGMGDSGRKATVPEAGEVSVRLPVRRTGVEEPEHAHKGNPREVEVSVAGWVTGSGTFLRAEVTESLFWRSEVVGGVARFAALPAGRWTFALEIPGRPVARWAADVPEGVGRLFLPFPSEADLAAGQK